MWRGEESGSVRDTESLEQVYRDMQLDVHVYQNCDPQVSGGGGGGVGVWRRGGAGVSTGHQVPGAGLPRHAARHTCLSKLWSSG